MSDSSNTGHNVLFVGTTQSNFLREIASQVQGIVAGLVCTQLNARGLDGAPLSGHGALRSLEIGLTPPRLTWPALLLESIRLKGRLHGAVNAWVEAILLVLFHPDRLRAAKRSMERRIHFVRTVVPRLQEFETVNAHLLFRHHVHLLWHLPHDKRVVCSFWGSDLLRCHGTLDHHALRATLERADAITIQTLELAEIMYAKFGRDLKTKTRIMRFPNSTEIRDAIDACRDDEDARRDFLQRMDLAPDAPVIVAGHNGHPMNNHRAILEAILPVLDHRQTPVNLILPFTYGGTPEYMSELQQIVGDLPRVRFQTDFLSPEDLARLRVATDVYIHMPETDAMSGALTESMYADARAITGAWLPYGLYRRAAGVDLLECASFNDLPIHLERALEGGRTHGSEDHRAALAQVFWSERTGGRWADVLTADRESPTDR